MSLFFKIYFSKQTFIMLIQIQTLSVEEFHCLSTDSIIRSARYHYNIAFSSEFDRHSKFQLIILDLEAGFYRGFKKIIYDF